MRLNVPPHGNGFSSSHNTRYRGRKLLGFLSLLLLSSYVSIGRSYPVDEGPLRRRHLTMGGKGGSRNIFDRKGGPKGPSSPSSTGAPKSKLHSIEPVIKNKKAKSKKASSKSPIETQLPMPSINNVPTASPKKSPKKSSGKGGKSDKSDKSDKSGKGEKGEKRMSSKASLKLKSKGKGMKGKGKSKKSKKSEKSKKSAKNPTETVEPMDAPTASPVETPTSRPVEISAPTSSPMPPLGSPTTMPVMTNPPSQAIVTETPTLAPVTNAPTPATVTGTPTPAPETSEPTPGSATNGPTPGTSTGAPTPGISTNGPTPGTVTGSPTPATGTAVPTPGAGTNSPTPGTETGAPTAATETSAPTPALETNAPTPGTTTDAPSPAIRTNEPTPGTASDAPTPAVATPIPTASPTISEMLGGPTSSPTAAMSLGSDIPATPFDSTFVDAAPNPSMEEFQDAELRLCDWLAAYFEDFYSLSFDTTLETFMCEATAFDSDPARIPFDVVVGFTDDSSLIPSQADIDVLISTAFQPPTVNVLLAILAQGGGSFATTTDVDYSIQESVQPARVFVKASSGSSGSPFVAGALLVFIVAGAVVTKTRQGNGELLDTEVPEEELGFPEEEQYYGAVNSFIGRRASNLSSTAKGFMGFDEAIEIDFMPAIKMDDDDGPCSSTSSPLFRRPFLRTNFGGDTLRS